jgi:hypothetical protein
MNINYNCKTFIVQTTRLCPWLARVGLNDGAKTRVKHLKAPSHRKAPALFINILQDLPGKKGLLVYSKNRNLRPQILKH